MTGFRLESGLRALALIVALCSCGLAQIPGQFAQDFVAGRVPAPEEVARVEADVAAHPDDYRLAGKLGKADFFQYFGEDRTIDIPKSLKTLERGLGIQKDDPQ